MPKDQADNKEQNKDNTSKSKKSSYSKKKKNKKNILNGIAYVQSTFNNTIVSIADTNGNVISWASAGQKGFKGSRKSTPYAAQVAADSAAAKALEVGMKILSVEVKGPGSGREICGNSKYHYSPNSRRIQKADKCGRRCTTSGCSNSK